MLSTTIAIQQSIDAGEAGSGLARVISGGILIAFSLWWLYFSRDDADVRLGRRNLVNKTWGFGHYQFTCGSMIRRCAPRSRLALLSR